VSRVSSRYEATLAWVKGSNVLDVGIAGQQDFHPELKSRENILDDPAWMHGMLRKSATHVTGIDIDATTISHLESIGFSSVYCQSAEEFALSEGPFDTIVAGEIIEHISNPGKFLERARIHLRQEGRVVLTTPNPFSLLYFVRSLLRWPETSPNPEHVAWFCPGTLQVLASRAGFRVSKVVAIEDYDPGAARGRYGLFQTLVRVFRPIIPDRLRCNSVLYVLEPS
jgi:2-polyprenyl-3-methyl-5-hydroxy-6-metoxy-1,4-benzoquinol methylase